MSPTNPIAKRPSVSRIPPKKLHPLKAFPLPSPPGVGGLVVVVWGTGAGLVLVDDDEGPVVVVGGVTVVVAVVGGEVVFVGGRLVVVVVLLLGYGVAVVEVVVVGDSVVVVVLVLALVLVSVVVAVVVAVVVSLVTSVIVVVGSGFSAVDVEMAAVVDAGVGGTSSTVLIVSASLFLTAPLLRAILGLDADGILLLLLSSVPTSVVVRIAGLPSLV